jgi:HEAT repeat protein
MNEGFKTTLECLAATQNEAAVRVLVPALDSPHRSIRLWALTSLVKRRSPIGHREVLRRLHTLDDSFKDRVANSQGRINQALRDALLGNDQQLAANACQAALWFREYDLIPSLIAVLENPTGTITPLAGRTLLELTELLYSELASPRADGRRRDPQILRHRVVADLEQSVTRFAKHKRRQIVEAFLLLVNRDNVTLKQILSEPRHPAFVVLVDTLAKSPAGGVMRLLLNFLDDPHAPSVTISVVSRRTDLKFVHHLLNKLEQEVTAVVRQNLKRITMIAWLQGNLALLDQLDPQQQRAAVRLAMTSGLPKPHAFPLIERLLRCGRGDGCRAAAEALDEFQGAEANQRAMEALDHEDPQVQAIILPQIRRRGIPGALPRLVEMIDSPHAMVRQAVRECLSEFSFKRFLAAFDMLDDEVRRSTGMLVNKIDSQTVPMLETEMASHLHVRRLRALSIARVIEAVPKLEEWILCLLGDEDHLVRAEAAAALSQSMTPASREALERALQDRSPIVQEAARKSLDVRLASQKEKQGSGEEVLQ